jgi:ribosomal protein L37AE/L43A
MLNKFLEITKAWITAVNPSEQQQQIADQRIAVCNDCESRKYNEITDIYYCGECGCPLKGKIYSPVEKSCPKQKWPV